MTSYKIIRSGNNIEIYQFQHTAEIQGHDIDEFNKKRNRYIVLKQMFKKHLYLIEQCERLIEKGVNCDDIKAKIRRENAHMIAEYNELEDYFKLLQQQREENKNDEYLKMKRRKQTLRDNANDLKRVVRENFGQYAFMITLTYSDQYICKSNEIDKSDRRLKGLFKKLRDYGYDFKYVGVRELQEKRGAIHYHLIFEDEQFYQVYKNSNAAINNKKKNDQHKQFENDFQKQFWKYGFVDIRHIEGIDDTGAYIAKYLMKADVKQMEWLENRRLVLRSKGIKKVSPVSPEDTQFLDVLSKNLEFIKILAHNEQLNKKERKKVFMNSYENKFTGTTVYYEIHLNRLEESDKKYLQSLINTL